jgi:hypothetical protein
MLLTCKVEEVSEASVTGIGKTDYPFIHLLIAEYDDASVTEDHLPYSLSLDC